MKIRLFFVYFIMIGLQCFNAQTQTLNNTDLNAQSIMLKASATKSDLDVETYPYLFDELFLKARIAGSDNLVPVRYNVFEDTIEYQYQGKTMTLFKKPEYSPIYIIEPDMILELLTYEYKNATVTGYLSVVLQTNTLTLLKKISKKYTPEFRAKDSFERDRPAMYQNNQDVYFIQNQDGKITEFPKNKKGLIALFPDKKGVISSNIKNYKMNDADLKKIIILLGK